MKILGLDIGSHHSAAAVLVVKDGQVVGVQEIEEWVAYNRELSARLMYFEGWLKGRVHRSALMGTDIIAVEEPYVRYARAALVLGQILGIVRTVAWWREMELVLISAAEGKAALTGNGDATKEETLAAASMQFPGFGWSEHTADALGVGCAAWGRLKEKALLEGEKDGEP